jgi:MtN3 and saliva related transmembrane protein
MPLDAAEALGLVAGLVSTLASAPQLVKIIRTRSAQDVSLTMFVMALAGTVMWSVYGWLKGAPSIVLWNVVGFCLFAAIIALKLRHSPRP